MSKSVTFAPQAWEDYVDWQTEDRKTLKQINKLIKDIVRSPYAGMGKPEQLHGKLASCWSRRIDDKNRIVYQVTGEKVEILSCKNHYDDK